MKHLALPLLIVAGAGGAARGLPTVVVDRDNVSITQSCTVVIPPGLAIEDADGNGVIHVAADGIEITFAEGSELLGRPRDEIRGAWDRLSGTGIRVAGRTGVTIRGAAVGGYKVGLHAEGAHGLTIDGGKFADLFRRRLASTPLAEAGADWLSPHRNDQDQWITTWGGAIYVEESSGVTVRGVRVRRAQNGILLDEVTDSAVYDNDASFLSGWGLGMFRSSRNTVTRNAFDFCVRGHSEGVYNRGQDSAGILMFEQCSENVIAENSATHGGDGIFGFAGLEAIAADEFASLPFDRTRVGCNDNVFLRNDLSYAPAHGLEMTFSFGNVIYGNRFVENAICGVWGGFSQQTRIAGNLFDANGGMPYGLENGGVNIEHGIDNAVVDNRFVNNLTGVHLWYDDPGVFGGANRWGLANYGPLTGNAVARNAFVFDAEPRPLPAGTRVGIRLRDSSGAAGPRLIDPAIRDNTFDISAPGVVQTAIDPIVRPDPSGPAPAVPEPTPEILGETRPVRVRDGVPFSAREHLRGRHMIVMDAWGPWDHEGTLLRTLERGATAHRFEVFGVPGELSAVRIEGDAQVSIVRRDDATPPRHVVTLAGSGGPPSYRVLLAGAGFRRTVSHLEPEVVWHGRVWNWTGRPNPMADLAGWLAAWNEPGRSTSFASDGLSVDFGSGGPRDAGFGNRVETVDIGPDRFGIAGEAYVHLAPGEWRVRTYTDDGIRVLVDGEPVLENWTIHGPTEDVATFRVAEGGQKRLEVQYFENDGLAVLEVAVERSGDDAPLCPADWDADGTAGVADLLWFLGDFRAASPAADLDASGDVGVHDLLAFLGSFRAGC